MALNPVPKVIGNEIHKFVTGSDESTGTKLSSNDVTTCALYLLRTVPSARHGVLEHLSGVLDEAVNRHFIQLELGSSVTETNTENEEAILQDIHEVLLSYIKSSPLHWAPIISTWAIELLGGISSKYASKRAIQHSSNSLNEQLQFWMSCSATKFLMEISTQCFASMVGGSPDSSINKLLEASVKHSPHFDWVVAHIGSCFPNTIITKVLSCGLKDFCYHGNKSADVAMATEENLPKMPSVVGILGHLAQQHGHNIKTALLQLFKDSIESDPDSMQIMTVPYLLHLASMSPLLLRVISTEFLTALTPHNLNMLCQQSTYWHSKNKQDINSLLNLLVHLLMKCEDQTFEIIMFLLNSSQQGDGCQVNPLVQRACTIILSKVLLDLERQILSKHDNEKEIVLLSSLKPHVERLCLKLVESTDTRCKRWLIQILACVGWYNGLACVNHILAFLLLNISTESQLGVFIELQREIEIRLPAVLLNIMSTLSLLTGKGTTSSADVYKLLKNLTTIVKWENESKTPLTRCQFKECIIKNMATFASFFSDGDLETGIQCLHLLNMIDLPGNLETVTLVTLARSCVATLFSICSTAGDTDEGYKNKQRNTDTLCAYVTKLSESATAYRYIQRTLLTQLLTKENVPLFGHKQDQASFSSSSKSTPTSLFEELQKTQRESTVAHHHGGIIGQGKRVHTQDDSFTQDDQATNRLCALRMLWATCCRRTDNESAGGASQVIGEHLHHLSNLMVELVTPDACYNEIPWPDEDLMKVTLERDLYIKKQFDTKPILWDIMELISFDHLAIAKSSPLLRGLVAVQVNYWVSCRDKNTTDSPQSEQYLRESNRLLEFMAKGNLLPQPLCFIAEFFRHVSPFKVFLLLTNVWAFIKENPDNLTSETPTLLPGCATNFMALIQNLMHADIDKLGHYYPLFFQKT